MGISHKSMVEIVRNYQREPALIAEQAEGRRHQRLVRERRGMAGNGALAIGALEGTGEIGRIAHNGIEKSVGLIASHIGLHDLYTGVVGNQQYLREVYGMDAESIADRAEALINEKRTDA